LASYRQSSRRVDRLTPQVTGHVTNCAIGDAGFPTPAAPPIHELNREPVMTDQQLVVSAMRQVGLIVAEHLELGMQDADEVITQLVAVLDTEELA
jgi:hypothetical protein